MIVVGVQPTIDTAIYAARDAVGGLITFDMGKGFGCKEVKIKRASLLEDAVSPISASLDLNLFTDPTMVCPDQGPFTISNANFLAGKSLGVITFANASYGATDVGTNAAAVICVQNGIDRIIPLMHGKIYGQLSVNTGTPDFAAATDLTILLEITKLL